eukprot:scaffold1066_cov177-Skeletonema_marinoi.AAC.11
MKFVFAFTSLSTVLLSSVPGALSAETLTVSHALTHVSIIDRLLPTPCLQPTNLRGATLVTDLQDQDAHSSSSWDCPCIDGVYSEEICYAIEGCWWIDRMNERAKMLSVLMKEGMEWGLMPCDLFFSSELSFRIND